MRYLVFLFLSLCVSAVIIEEAKRTIDLKSHLTKINYDFTLSGDLKEFTFVIEKSNSENLAFISAKQRKIALDVIEIQRNDKGDRQFTFSGFETEASVRVKVKCIFFGLQKPKPTEILQKEQQNVKYHGNSLIYSIYPIKMQSSEVILPQTTILNYHFEDKKFTKAAQRFHLGPYKSTEPFGFSIFAVHYTTAGDFLTVTNLDRSIELSHWGNVAIEDTIDIYHSGSLLKGEFSRFDLRYGHGLQNAVRSWVTFLPLNARDIYYRDAIGNISTSHVVKRSNAVSLEIEPRFPLMGGWKTQYLVGYNLPNFNYLFNSGEDFAFRFKIIDHIHDNQFIEKMNLEIVLPECIEDVRIETPYRINRKEDIVRPTYLDTEGRKVIRLNKENLVEEHIQDMVVYYKFNHIKMIREFVFVIVAIFTIFVSIIVYMHLDFSIQKDNMKEAQQKIKSIVVKVIDIQESQFNIYEKLENLLKVYRFEKDQHYFNSEWKKLLKSHSENKTKICAIKSKISAIYLDGNEMLTSLLEQDKSVIELMNEKNNLTEKLVTNKINKTQFQTSATQLMNKKTNLFESMESILDRI